MAGFAAMEGVFREPDEWREQHRLEVRWTSKKDRGTDCTKVNEEQQGCSGHTLPVDVWKCRTTEQEITGRAF